MLLHLTKLSENRISKKKPSASRTRVGKVPYHKLYKVKYFLRNNYYYYLTNSNQTKIPNN